MKKIIRITTVPVALKVLLKGQLKFMNQYYEIIGVASSGNEHNDLHRDEGIRTEVIEMTRTISPIKDILSTYKLYKFLKQEKPFIVHTHTPKAGIVGMLASYLAGVEHRFHTVAGLPLLVSTGPKRILLNLVEKWTYRLATKVLPNSHGLCEIILKEKFAKSEKLQVIGKGSSNGINIEYFNPNTITDQEKTELKNELQLKDEDFVFVFVGRLVKDKGINELIQAFEHVSKIEKNCKLILLGSREDHLDPLLEQTETIIAQNKNIIAVGFKKDIRPYLAISKILLFPSYREGFPNAVMQAGAMGLPSIVTDINGCNEIIQQNINGLIIPPKNTEALIDSMMYLKLHSSELLRMSSNSREIIVQNYQHDYIWNELLKVYQDTENQNVI